MTYTICEECTVAITNDDWTHLDANPETADQKYDVAVKFMNDAGWIMLGERVEDTIGRTCDCCGRRIGWTAAYRWHSEG